MEHGCKADWIGVCSLEQGVCVYVLARMWLTGSSENVSSYSLRKQLQSAVLRETDVQQLVPYHKWAPYKFVHILRSPTEPVD